MELGCVNGRNLISSADLITLACSKINFASTTSIPFLFRAVITGHLDYQLKFF